MIEQSLSTARMQKDPIFRKKHKFKSIHVRRAQICFSSMRTYYVKGVLRMLRTGVSIVLRKIANEFFECV